MRIYLGLIIFSLVILLIVVAQPRWFILSYYAVRRHKFYPLRHFPELLDITNAFEIIRAECIAVMSAPIHDVPRAQDVWTNGDPQLTKQYVEKTKTLYGWQPAWTPGISIVNHKWINMPFIINAIRGEPSVFYTANLAACPVLSALLIARQDIIQVAGFSRLRSGMRIAEHVDTTGLRYGSAAYHLGLIVPDPSLCSMTVDGCKIYHHEGQAFVFESTYRHHASNWSGGERVILYIDFKINV